MERGGGGRGRGGGGGEVARAEGRGEEQGSTGRVGDEEGGVEVWREMRRG